ncbi:MAG: GH1 family beta-glucosidase, partial [Candidatus Neomarinimicrobiota bacterium]
MSFPKDFIWGAASASYQIEGAVKADGRTSSIWDTFCQQPGRVWGGHAGEIGPDHYHHLEEDVELMADLGLKAYRFSVAWTRVLPEGTSPVNRRGIAFYDRLIDLLLEKGIEPWLTIFHWDYPETLFQRGGWLNADSPDWFAEYAGVLADSFGDRVTNWMTLNEPQVIAHYGHQIGIHAPGLKLALKDVLTVGHHLLLAHGKAVQILRTRCQKPTRVGVVPVGLHFLPATEIPADIETARKATFAVTERNTWNIAWWADPLILGTYPEDGLKLFAKEMPSIKPTDMETIAQPLDYFGTNIYNAEQVRAAVNGWEILPVEPNCPRTAMDWPVTPEALYWGPRFFYERYGLPVIIMENGMANNDWIHRDGNVHDPKRIDFITRYLEALHRAIADGVKVEGYFHWSIMDNFEWAEGYRKRFGLVYIDYETGRRIPKDSFDWYRKVICSNGD